MPVNSRYVRVRVLETRLKHCFERLFLGSLSSLFEVLRFLGLFQISD